MYEIVFSDQLKVDEASLEVHLGSDRRIWIRLDELCDFIGIDASDRLEDAKLELARRDLFTLMPPADDHRDTAEASEVEYIDMAALPFWLGLICSEPVRHPVLYEGLLMCCQDFLDVTWLVARAGTALAGVEFTGQPDPLSRWVGQSS